MICIKHMLGEAMVVESLLHAGAKREFSKDSCPGPASEILLADLLAQSLGEATQRIPNQFFLQGFGQD
jgi:hypothetical protein